MLARIAGSALFGAFQAAFFLLVLWPFGATIRGGIPAFLDTLNLLYTGGNNGKLVLKV